MWKRKTAATATAAAIALINSSCAIIPTANEAIRARAQQEVTTTASAWNTIAPVERIEVGVPVLRPRFEPIPAKLAGKIINVEGTSQISMRDFVGLLGIAGIPAVVSDNKIAQLTFALPSYRGPLEGLLRTVERATDIGFEWRSGAIAAVETHEYVAYLPQHKDFIELVSKDLSALGARTVSASRASGSVTLRAPPSASGAVRDYLDSAARNAATVNLQIAAIAVSLNRESDSGIQWGQLQAIIGNPASLLTATTPSAGTGTGTGTGAGTGSGAGTGTGAGTGAGAAVQIPTGEAIGLLGQGVGIRIRHNAFSLAGLVSALSRYGSARTVQDVILRTLSGSPVKIRSGESVPYISGISVSALGTQTGTAGLLGSASVATAESGLTLEVDPSYDESSGLVTMKVNLDLATILGFIELSAGAQVGKLSQPNIQKQSFNTVARLRAGDTVILGGLVFDNETDNRSGIAGLENQPLASRAAKTQRSVLFIVIRPTVTVYEFKKS